MKLLLFLSHSGMASRRKAFEDIRNGNVSVNGKAVLEPSTAIDPVLDKVHYKGRPVGAAGFDYILLNKPAGYVTTCEGQFGQKTVMDLLPAPLKHVRPVGRLDKDTEGLLLFTNDGELANLLTHPRYDVDKTYAAQIRRALSQEAVRRLESGIMIEGKKTAPARVRVIRSGGNVSDLEITIHEGRKRQVRLMLSAVGNPVLRLKRLRQGPLELGDLRLSAWRRLTEEEIRRLKAVPFRPLAKRSEAPSGGRPQGRRHKRPEAGFSPSRRKNNHAGAKNKREDNRRER